MSLTTSALWPYVVLILVGFLPNEIWRWLGFALARGIDEGSEILVWVRAVATAVLAAVIAKLIFFAPGALATVPLTVRLAAIARRLCRLSSRSAVRSSPALRSAKPC